MINTANIAETRFSFGDIVVVEDGCIGVVVKSWINQRNKVKHEIYVRMLNMINTYPESKIQKYAYDKHVDDALPEDTL